MIPEGNPVVKSLLGTRSKTNIFKLLAGRLEGAYGPFKNLFFVASGGYAAAGYESVKMEGFASHAT